MITDVENYLCFVCYIDGERLVGVEHKTVLRVVPYSSVDTEKFVVFRIECLWAQVINLNTSNGRCLLNSSNAGIDADISVDDIGCLSFYAAGINPAAELVALGDG